MPTSVKLLSASRTTARGEVAMGDCAVGATVAAPAPARSARRMCATAMCRCMRFMRSAALRCVERKELSAQTPCRLAVGGAERDDRPPEL
eukprot:3981377-Prymnesium_polylepis.1